MTAVEGGLRTSAGNHKAPFVSQSVGVVGQVVVASRVARLGRVVRAWHVTHHAPRKVLPHVEHVAWPWHTQSIFNGDVLCLDITHAFIRDCGVLDDVGKHEADEVRVKVARVLQLQATRGQKSFTLAQGSTMLAPVETTA